MRLCFVLLLLLSCAAYSEEPAQGCPSRAWTNREHYREANLKLQSIKPERRVVFLGASMVQGWELTKYFPGKNYVNRGIAGQGTALMLLRFHQDVTQLRPRAVVIFPGLNDLAAGVSLDDIRVNLTMMAQLAKANEIRVLFASAQPINSAGANALGSRLTPEKVRELNRWMFQYAKDHGDIYVDLWSPLGDEKYSFSKELTSDGVHPNEAGYKVIAPVLEKRLGKAFAAGLGRIALKGD